MKPNEAPSELPEPTTAEWAAMMGECQVFWDRHAPGSKLAREVRKIATELRLRVERAENDKEPAA